MKQHIVREEKIDHLLLHSEIDIALWQAVFSHFALDWDDLMGGESFPSVVRFGLAANTLTNYGK